MSEQLEQIYTPYSYTYDQFTVFFHGGRVYIGEKNYSVGQCCVDILNLNERILDELEQRVQNFVPAAWTSWRKKQTAPRFPHRKS